MALSKSTMLELSNIDGRVKTSGTSMEGEGGMRKAPSFFKHFPKVACSADVSGLVVGIQ